MVSLQRPQYLPDDRAETVAKGRDLGQQFLAMMKTLEASEKTIQELEVELDKVVMGIWHHVTNTDPMDELGAVFYNRMINWQPTMVDIYLHQGILLTYQIRGDRYQFVAAKMETDSAYSMVVAWTDDARRLTGITSTAVN